MASHLLGASSKNNDSVFACRNPLGDPRDLTKPINMQAFPVSTDTSQNNKTGVQCMQIGQGGNCNVKGGLAIGADGQPYIGGLNFISNFTNFPACIAPGFGVPAGTTTDAAIAAAFAAHSANHCGIATRNTSSTNTAPDGVTALKVETQALRSRGNYLCHGVKGGTIYQPRSLRRA